MKRRNLVVAIALGIMGAHVPSYGAEPEVVKIGFAAPLTGPVARVGKDLQYGAQLALDEENAKNPTVDGKPVKFVLDVQDDQADPRFAIQAAQKLVDDGVAGVIGHYNSGCSIPASAVYHQADVAMITPGSTNPQLTKQGFKNVFRTMGHDGIGGVVAGHFVVEQIKAKRIGIIDDRTGFGQGLADAFEKGVKEANGNIVDREFTNDKAVDFRAVLTTLKSKNVDVIFFGGLDRQAAAVAKRMKQLGITAQFVGGGGVMDTDFLKLAGDAADGAMAWEYGSPLEKLPQGKAFAEKFQKHFGVAILSYAPFGYDAAWAAINAMQKGNSIDPKVYRPVLKAISFPGITGTIAFDNNGALKNASSTMYQVKGGAWVPIVTKSGT